MVLVKSFCKYLSRNVLKARLLMFVVAVRTAPVVLHERKCLRLSVLEW